MLSVLAKESPNLKTFILTQLLLEKGFKIKLYMDKLTSAMKIDRIKDLARKNILINAQIESDRVAFEDSLEFDIEKLLLHIAIIELLCVIGDQNFYAIKQIRNLLD